MTQRGQHVALLRSLVVAPEITHGGLGRRLVGAAEERMAGMNVTAIYLLTTTAARFFERLGYRHLQRDLAPTPIKASSQFASLCPASAQLMVKP